MSNLAVESWSWYGLTWLVVVTRMASQILLRGSIKKLKLDDFLMVLIMLTDTVLMVAMNIISSTDSNLIDPSRPTTLTPEDVRLRVFGSKMVLLAEQMQCITIWLTKACLLLMYHRLTMSLKSNLVVKLVAAYAGFGFIIMEILYLGVWCRPFNQYWAVPPNSTQCSAATNHLITNAVLNISSDVMIILIPMPVFLQSKLALKKKFILMGVFALGGFTILSSILNKFYSFNEPFGSQWTFWYIRESSTAIIVTNLPLTWTVFRRLFNLRSFNNSEYSSKSRSRHPGSTMRSHGQTHDRTFNRDYIRQRDADDPLADSQEEINKGYGISLKIYQRHDVQISSEPAPAREGHQHHHHHHQPSNESLPDGLTTTIQGGLPQSFLHDPDIGEELPPERTCPTVKAASGV